MNGMKKFSRGISHQSLRSQSRRVVDHGNFWRSITGNVYEMVKTNQLVVLDRLQKSASIPRQMVEKV